jgi:hypothetical protein
MAYYLDLFSPETYEAFTKSTRGVSGFRLRQEHSASKIEIGDKFVCYMTKLGRWIGVLEVTSTHFRDSTPLFLEHEDPFVLRFKVKPVVWLPKENALPIREDRVWTKLSFTKGLDKGGHRWTAAVRSSLRLMDNADGEFLEKFMLAQAKKGETFEVDESEYLKLIRPKVRREGGEVAVAVPIDAEPEAEAPTKTEVRTSTRIQALLASIGARMGMKIWLPRNNRTGVMAEWKSDDYPVLDELPLNYDETTLKTIEQIDVLWLKGRAIVRAFEIEHTTSIYSGILRMADLLALQPNMNINLHIVAPLSRRDKVFQELQRPVFSLLEAGPLAERCTYLSYESVESLDKEKMLGHMADSVVEEYAEQAE